VEDRTSIGQLSINKMMKLKKQQEKGKEKEKE
jgi:hypothetical protein